MAKTTGKAKTQKRGRGRPSPYTPELCIAAKALARLGLTDEETAKELHICTDTLYEWQKIHPEFSEALKAGKEAPDDAVEASLYQRATGYSHSAVKIFMPANADAPVYADYTEHFPPDVTACIFWLKNRRPEKWRDKTEVEHSGGIAVADLSGLSPDERMALLKAVEKV